MRKEFGSRYEYILGSALTLRCFVDDTTDVSGKVTIYYYPDATIVVEAEDMVVDNSTTLSYVFQTDSDWDRGQYVAVFTLTKDNEYPTDDITIIEEIFINLDAQTMDKIS